MRCAVIAIIVFWTSLVHSTHVFDEEIEFNVLKRNFVKNLLADSRSAKQANRLGAGLNIDGRVNDFKSTFNNELQRRKHLGAGRRRRSLDGDVKGGIPTLMGFEEIAYIPVAFALDICLFHVGTSLHVATLHLDKNNQSHNSTELTLLHEWPPHSFNFTKYYNFQTKNARRMDCVSTTARNGLVVVVNTIDNNHPLTHDAQLEMGSPVFRITETAGGKEQHVELVQFFNRKNQQRVDFWVHGNNIFLIQTIETFNTTLWPHCPIFKWTGFNFNLMQELPCMNAVEVQKFTIHQEFYVTFANHRNDEGATNIFSYVYKLDTVADKFELHQRLYTNAVNDIRYFYFDNDHVREHFLIVGNSFELDDFGRPNYEAHSMVYKFVNGFFTPFQSIQLNRVKKVLPVIGESGEFVLLVACENDEIKLFQYDGWRFYAASIDYTGAAFEKGVAYMRTYRNINNRTLISIANENVYGEHANIFAPTFRLHDDLEAVHASILKWCDDNYKRLSEQNLPGLLATVAKLPKIGKETINLTGKLTLQRGAVKKLETETLKTPKGTLDAELAKSINAAHTKVLEMQAAVRGIEKKLEQSIEKNGTVTLVGDIRVDRFESSAGNATELDVTTLNGLLIDATKSRERAVAQNDVLNITVEVDELVVEDGLEAHLLNDVPTASILHAHDTLNLPNLTIHARDVVFETGLYVAKTIDGVKFTPQHVIFHDMDQTLVDDLRTPNLVVQHLNTLSLNGLPVEETLHHLHELVEKTNQPTAFRRIDADNLTLHGTFNGLDILALADITLKNHGDQQLEAEFDIETLTTPQLATTATISGEALSNIVRTDSGTFVVNQDVLFAAPLEVNDLIVEERINNINVQNGKLDMLVKRSTNVQVITGDKVFERLRLMGSIELQGKIRSESLNKMNPIATLDQDLFLDGDYTINGNVTIKRLLNASDIFGQSKVHSVSQLLTEGLAINAVVPFPVDFRQHIKVDHLVADKLNDLDPRHFVRANVEENQAITGHKVFAQDLTVKIGLCDAEKVNGVNMRTLNATILKIHGDQEVRGRIHFSKVVAKSVATTNKTAKLAGLMVSEFLTSNSQQLLPAKLTVNGTVHVRAGLEVVYLNTSGQLFGHTMTNLIEDTIVHSLTQPVKISGDKYFTSCQFADLKMVSPTATFCNVNLSSLQDRIGELTSELLIQQPVHFESPMHVKHLTFEHTLNGMRKNEFGTSWLLSESEQTFSEPQIFENLLAEDEVLLDGLCNGHNITDLYGRSYSLLRDEDVVGDIEFSDGVVFQQSVRIDGTLTGINLSEQALLLNASRIQHIDELTVTGNVTVTEGITINERLNGVDFQKLAVFTGNEPSEGPLILQVLGDAEFKVDPVIEAINGVNLNELVKDAWFLDENVVIEADIQMQEVFFDKMLTLKGTLNHLSLDYLINNYVSLTAPQEISVRLKFTGNAIFENVLSADELVINGTLRGYSFFEGLDISEFDKFVLKKGVPQTITAPWHFKELHYTDNVQTCRINGLNMADDVLRYDQPRPLTGHKHFTRLQVKNVNCPVPCFFGDVNLSDWIGKAVLNFGNYTIQGTTILRNPVVYSNILSLGPVNNLTFDADTLMLKSANQVVGGDMHIKTKFVEANRIWMMLFENLYVVQINGRRVDEFLVNVARIDEIPLTIETKLHVLEPLTVNQLQCVDCRLFGVNVSSLMTEFEEKLLVGRYEKGLAELHGLAKSLAEAFESRAYYLNHFELRQSIYGSILKVMPIELLPGVTHLAVFKAEAKLPPTIWFYRWDMNNTSFEVDYGVPPLPSNDHLTITKFEKVMLHHKEYLVVETYDKPRRAHIMALHRFTDHSFDIAYQFASNVSASVIALTVADKQCLGLYSEFKADFFVTCLAPDGYTLVQHQVVKTTNVKQVVTLPGHVLLLNVDLKIVVLTGYPLQPIQVIHSINPSYIAGVFHRQHRYLAVCSEKAENSVHHGLVEIYRSIGGEHFHHFQTIAVKIPIQVEFSVLPTQELMLYIVTNNPTQPIYIYQYAGAAGFKEFIHTSMIPRGQAMQVVQLPELQKEFVALTAKDEVVLIEACMKY